MILRPHSSLWLLAPCMMIVLNVLVVLAVLSCMNPVGIGSVMHHCSNQMQVYVTNCSVQLKCMDIIVLTCIQSAWNTYCYMDMNARMEVHGLNWWIYCRHSWLGGVHVHCTDIARFINITTCGLPCQICYKPGLYVHRFHTLPYRNTHNYKMVVLYIHGNNHAYLVKMFSCCFSRDYMFNPKATVTESTASPSACALHPTVHPCCCHLQSEFSIARWDIVLNALVTLAVSSCMWPL